MASTCLRLLALMVVYGLLDSSSAVLVVGTGACPNPGTESGFIQADYLGDWYEYERFPNTFEIGLDCGKAAYGDNGDGTISVVNSGIFRVSIFGRQVISRTNSVTGSASVPDPAKPAELLVSFGNFNPGGSDPNYFVVDTDYNTYAVVFSCSRVAGINIQFAWILTRTRDVAPNNLSALKANLAAAGINVNRFRRIDQTSCTN